MNGVNPIYGYPEKYHAIGSAFFVSYILEKETGCPDNRIREITQPNERLCRFCNRRYPIVTFRKDAHIISEFLGNRYLISDFECDECNAKFGRYEDQLSKFLGISRTMLGLKSKERKVPKFKSPNEDMILEFSENPPNESIIKATRSDNFGQSFEFDKNTKTTTLHFVKQPYIPLQAYKALLKMALCCIDQRDVSNYKLAFEYLRSNKHDNEWTGCAIVKQYLLPYTFCFEKPSCYLYRKRNPHAPLYTHTFVLYALNSIFQIIIPFNDADLKYLNISGGLELPSVPPLFGIDYPYSDDTIGYRELDFNYAETRKGEKDLICMRTDDSYEVSTKINPHTGEIYEVPFDAATIKAFEFIRTPLETNNEEVP